jgi:hypothetical protein
MTWEGGGHGTRVGEVRNANKILVKKPEENILDADRRTILK